MTSKINKITAGQWVELLSSTESMRIARNGRRYTKINPKKPPKGYKKLSFSELIRQTNRININELKVNEQAQLNGRLSFLIKKHQENLDNQFILRRPLTRLVERILNWRQRFRTSIGLAKKIQSNLPKKPSQPTGNLSKRGMNNLGCTCYMNSAIQMLKVIPGFQKNLRETENKTPLQAKLNNLLGHLSKPGKSIPSNAMNDFFNECRQELIYMPETHREQFDPIDWINQLFNELQPKTEGIAEVNLIGHNGNLETNPQLIFNQSIDIPLYTKPILAPTDVWKNHQREMNQYVTNRPDHILQQLNRTPDYRENTVFEFIQKQLARCDIKNEADKNQLNYLQKTLKEYPNKEEEARRQSEYIREEMDKYSPPDDTSKKQFDYARKKLGEFQINAGKTVFEYLSEQMDLYVCADGENSNPKYYISRKLREYPYLKTEKSNQTKYLKKKLEEHQPVEGENGNLLQYMKKQLNRFSKETQKDDACFDFNQILEVPISKFENDKFHVVETKRYRAKAVIIHSGKTPQSGHYRSLVRSGNKWWLYNDSQVSLEENIGSEEYQREAFAVLWKEIPESK